MTLFPSPSWTPRNGIVLGVALLLGIAAALLAMHHLQRRTAEIERRGTQEMAHAVVPKEDLGAGTVLDHDRVAVRKVPAQWLHAEAISPEQFDQVSQSVLAFPVRRGEPLLWSQIAQHQTSSFATHLQGGRRALTVPVDEVSSLSGLLAPGDTIDLLLNVKRHQGTVTLALQQGVRVLAAGGETEREHGNSAPGRAERSYSTITLDVSLEEGRRIVAARTVGTLTALLRSPGDRAIEPLPAAEALALLGLSAPARPQPRSVPVIYGGMSPQQLEAELSPLQDAGPIRPGRLPTASARVPDPDAEMPILPGRLSAAAIEARLP